MNSFKMVYRNRLRQVLINILDNAFKFTPPGRKITVRTTAQGGQVIVSIQDEGLGISPQELPQVKEKFFKGYSQKPGSGIGLAIADENFKTPRWGVSNRKRIRLWDQGLHQT